MPEQLANKRCEALAKLLSSERDRVAEDEAKHKLVKQIRDRVRPPPNPSPPLPLPRGTSRRSKSHEIVSTRPMVESHEVCRADDARQSSLARSFIGFVVPCRYLASVLPPNAIPGRLRRQRRL